MRNGNKRAIARRIPREPTHDDALVVAKHDRTNGVRPRLRLKTLSDLDGRTFSAQQAHRLVAQLEADLGGDLSTAQRELVKRAAILGAIVEDTEVAWLERKPADLTVYGTLVDRQRRCLEALGLQRLPRDVSDRVPAVMTPNQFGKLVDIIKESV